jgi:hypothetical protein
VPDVVWVDNRIIVTYPPTIAIPTDEDLRRSVINAAEFTKGVIDVNDELTIRPVVAVSSRVC